MSKKLPRKKANVKVEPELHKRLREHLKSRGIAIEFWVNQVITDALSREIRIRNTEAPNE